MSEFEDLEIYPVEASERGDNSFYLEHCSVAHKRPAYAACLKKIADRKGGRLNVVFADCSAAIGKKECPAQKLREKELKEGRALFYIRREKLQAFSQYRDEMGMQRLASMVGGESKSGKKGSKPAPDIQRPAPRPATPSFDSGDYAAAINRAISEEAKKPASNEVKQEAKPPAPQQPAQPAAPAGLSLIELGRLQMAAKAA